MDPVITRTHDEEGFVVIDESIKLHYELYWPSSHSPTCPKVLMMMGAFATAAHFANEARVVANAGYEVCIYDHRGVAKSGPARKEQQTAELLASDAAVLIDTLWGPNAAVHVYGASMGGMVAQELAVLLLPQRRLLSLGLAVTCRGLKPFGGLLSPIITPQVLKLILQTWYWDSRPALVRRLMRLLLSRNILDTVHPSGQTLGTVYFREWLAHFEDYWTLKDHTVGACHACVVLTHYLSERKVQMIRDSGVPVLCQVSTRDHVIPVQMQFDLATKLKARTVTFPTGHMGVLPWKDQFHKLLLEHFAIGDAVRGIHCAEAARSARREQQQLLLLQPQWRSVLLLQPALSASSAASSRSSSSSSGEFLVMPMAAAAAAGDLIRSSGDLSSVISDVSSADLTVDVADWSGSSSSGGVSKDIVTLQQQQQQVLGLA